MSQTADLLPRDTLLVSLPSAAQEDLKGYFTFFLSAIFGRQLSWRLLYDWDISRLKTKCPSTAWGLCGFYMCCLIWLIDYYIELHSVKLPWAVRCDSYHFKLRILGQRWHTSYPLSYTANHLRCCGWTGKIIGQSCCSNGHTTSLNVSEQASWPCLVRVMLIVNHSEPNTNKECLFVCLSLCSPQKCVLRATFIAAILKVRKVTGISLDASVIQWLALLDHCKKVMLCWLVILNCRHLRMRTSTAGSVFLCWPCDELAICPRKPGEATAPPSLKAGIPRLCFTPAKSIRRFCHSEPFHTLS